MSSCANCNANVMHSQLSVRQQVSHPPGTSQVDCLIAVSHEGHARGQGGQGFGCDITSLRDMSLRRSASRFQEFRRLPACRGAGGLGGQTERGLVQANAGQGASRGLSLQTWGPEWPCPCRAFQPAGAGQCAEFHHRASTPPGLLRRSLRRPGMLMQATVPASAGSAAGGPAACGLVLAGEVGGFTCSPTTTGPVRSTRRILTTRGTSTPTMATRTTTTRTMRCMPWLCAPEDDAP